jgi:hypothetical protein
LIEAIPLLATGKLDLKGIKNLAEELEKQWFKHVLSKLFQHTVIIA